MHINIIKNAAYIHFAKFKINFKDRRPTFLENLTSDINILLETWKGDSDKYKVIGYNCISKARKKKKKARRHSGGIIIYCLFQ
jgi:phage FluMu gp28-like protein